MFRDFAKRVTEEAKVIELITLTQYSDLQLSPALEQKIQTVAACKVRLKNLENQIVVNDPYALGLQVSIARYKKDSENPDATHSVAYLQDLNTRITRAQESLHGHCLKLAGYKNAHMRLLAVESDLHALINTMNEILNPEDAKRFDQVKTLYEQQSAQHSLEDQRQFICDLMLRCEGLKMNTEVRGFVIHLERQEILLDVRIFVQTQPSLPELHAAMDRLDEEIIDTDFLATLKVELQKYALNSYAIQKATLDKAMASNASLVELRAFEKNMAKIADPIFRGQCLELIKWYKENNEDIVDQLDDEEEIEAQKQLDALFALDKITLDQMRILLLEDDLTCDKLKALVLRCEAVIKSNEVTRNNRQFEFKMKPISQCYSISPNKKERKSLQIFFKEYIASREGALNPAQADSKGFFKEYEKFFVLVDAWKSQQSARERTVQRNVKRNDDFLAEIESILFYARGELALLESEAKRLNSVTEAKVKAKSESAPAFQKGIQKALSYAQNKFPLFKRHGWSWNCIEQPKTNTARKRLSQ
jgi:hypothetical protein